jgi:hypothetical protein
MSRVYNLSGEITGSFFIKMKKDQEIIFSNGIFKAACKGHYTFTVDSGRCTNVLLNGQKIYIF